MKYKQNKLRFADAYDGTGDVSNVVLTGLLVCESDFDLGTPNLCRDENVFIYSSNSTLDKSSLALRLKWRPMRQQQAPPLVSMISNLTLSFEDVLYRYEQVETFAPNKSQVRPNRVTQYGSDGSKLKLFINSPYRRMRIVFRGQMIRASDNQQVFVKLNLVISTASKIFDFKEEYNEKYVKALYSNNRYKQTKVSYETFLNHLFLHDRHEHIVRLVGDCVIRSDTTDTKEGPIDCASGTKKYNVVHYGFYGRHFIGDNLSSEVTVPVNHNDRLPVDQRNQIRSAQRVLALFTNGQAIHLGLFPTPSNDEGDNAKGDNNNSCIKFGYGCLTSHPVTEPIEKAFDLQWTDEQEAGKFKRQFKIKSICCGHKIEFDCSGELRFSYNSRDNFAMYDARLAGKSGFAWVTTDDDCDLIEDELEAISKSQENYLQDLDKGPLAIEPKLSSDVVPEPLIVALASDECKCSDLVGSKASSLAQLVALGSNTSGSDSFVVPKGFALTRFVYDKLVATQSELRNAIEQLERFVAQRIDYLDELDLDDGDDNDADTGINSRWLQLLPLECAKVRDALRNIDLQHANEELAKAVDHNIEQVFGQAMSSSGEANGPIRVAVRSSSWGEDEADMSAAGQLDTKLNIECNRQSILGAILDCFASKFSLENIEYKRQHGLPLNMPMGVVVQQMADCHKAGVMFTCDPTTGDDRFVLITANYGLGESVVSGQSEPDTVYVQKVNQRNGGSQSTQLQVRHVVIGEKKVIIGSVSDSLDRAKCCLSDDESLSLARCAWTVSKYFHSSPRDIEWGLIDGQVYLFQARPITGLDAYTERELMHEVDRPSPAELDFYSRCNVGEVMPFAITPLNLTHQIINWNLMGYRFISSLVSERIPYTPQCNFDVQPYGYHMFFNVRTSQFMPLTDDDYGKKSALLKATEISLFGHEMDPQPDIVEAAKGMVKRSSPFMSFRFFWRVKGLRFTPKRIVFAQKEIVRSLSKKVANLELAKGYEHDKLRGLYNQLNRLFEWYHSIWINHIAVLFIGSGDNMLLTLMLSKYIKDSAKQFAMFSKLVTNSGSGEKGDNNNGVVISAEIPRRFRAFAEEIKRVGGAEELDRFLKMSTRQAIDYLQDEQSNPELSKMYKEFLDLFGHRCYNEFEYLQRSWREDKKGVVEMIKRNCRSLSTAAAQSDQQHTTNDAGTGDNNQSKKSETIDEILSDKNFDTPLSLRDRLIIKHLLAPSCRSKVQLREQTKDILVNHSDSMRQAARLLSRELCRQGRLPDESLMYYLLFDDLEPLIKAHQPQLVMQALRRRRLFAKLFDGKVLKFDEIIRGPNVFAGVLDPPYSGVSNEHGANDQQQQQQQQQVTASDKDRCTCLYGTPASSGSVRARISLVKDYHDLDKVRPGSILVTHSTDIAFSAIFPIISGIITEVGGLVSHGAVIAREYGLPSVLGVRQVTKVLADGELILLDADNGKIVRLADSGGEPDAAGHL